MSTDVTVTGQVTGTSPKGPIGPIDLALILQGQRSALQLDFEVDTSDVARVIALPAEGTAQSMFLLCADQEFTFTINGAGPTYTFKPGAVSGNVKKGIFLILSTPVVSTIEVTGGTVNAKGFLLRVMES